MTDPRTGELCDVCGAWLRAQGEYVYCPMEGFVEHIRTAAEKAER